MKCMFFRLFQILLIILLNNLMIEMDYELGSIDEVSRLLVKNVSSKIIVLYGDMGSGKTTLIKSIVKNLGSDDEVSSPTFSIVNEYKALDDTIYHFDLYRLENIEEAYNFGIEEYIYSNHWVIIEWPQLIESILPKESNRVDLYINNDGSRRIELNFKTNMLSSIRK